MILHYKEDGYISVEGSFFFVYIVTKAPYTPSISPRIVSVLLGFSLIKLKKERNILAKHMVMLDTLHLNWMTPEMNFQQGKFDLTMDIASNLFIPGSIMILHWN